MTTQRIRRFVLLVLFPILIVLSIVYLSTVSQEQDVGIRASGTVEAVEVVIAAEVPGRIVEVLADEGDQVEAGDLLIQLDDELLLAQRERALAAVRTAQAAVDSAHVNLELLELQVELTRRVERRSVQTARENSWQSGTPVEFDLPTWYFDQAEQIAAAEQEVELAIEHLRDEQAKLEEVLGDSSMADLLEAETRLADARAGFLIAEDVLERARRARDDQELEEYAEELFEAAETELEAAQSAYQELLSDKDAEDVLEARARAAVSQERYDTALDRLAALQTGEHSLQLRAAERSLDQAHAAVVQAEAVLAQAQAELTVIDMQLARMALTSPLSGVVVTRSVERGEVLQPGAVAMTIAQVEELTITVFVQEDRYGQIRLGQSAIVTVDSFPAETFTATVTKIADQAEYTPRNVQTEEGRRTTVFAIELELVDPTGRLKPGMPADVEFIE